MLSAGVRWKILLVLVATLGFLLWVLWGIDLAEARVRVDAFKWVYYVPIMVLYLCTHALRVYRLEWILGQKLKFWPVFSVLSIGYLALNTMPFRLGEFVRPYLMSERQGIPMGTGLAAVFVERLVDILALLGMVWLCVFWVEVPPGAIVVGGTDILAAGQKLAGAALIVGTLGFGLVLALGERALVLTDRLPLGGFIRRFVGGLRSLAARPVDFARILAITVVIWGLTIGAINVQLRAFPGLPTSVETALVVWTATLSGMSAIPTPGFFGGFEAFCTAALVMLGVDGDAARVFAVLLHLGQFVCTVVTGLVFLVYEGLSLRDVVARSRAAARSA